MEACRHTEIPKAVVLSSGGLDSTTAMAMARREGFALYALSFDYGQRHVFELEAARRVAASMGVRQHLVVKIDLQVIGGSALTSEMAVPKSRSLATMQENEIPVTYVPARNTIFLSYALAWAEVLGACDIFIGVNAIDYSGYPDCRPAYIEAFEKMANLATKASVEGKMKFRIRTPLLLMDKAQIIQTGIALGVDYGLTHSCYDPDSQGLACGRCDSCALRRAGFEKAGIPDPTRYQRIP
ncbi:7-cyano-7-deazaguanine synthase QueC [Desulfatirhabdium butyrativorans]|uniref:7-cyano-7-deazaguanine synthase QueC n=1 Tax=Desulfatirhabdium butyrativorans TaxID=340467 RepID=UPI000484C953|nr:7-cyano-7-deazaguanine synthase QueC [Desulfatirhabdium butyrativorans]